MRHFILFGIVGAVAGTIAAVVGNFAMPRQTVGDIVGLDNRIDVRVLFAWDKPHEYLTYFLLGALVCGLIGALSNEHRGPQVQLRSFFVGIVVGGVLCVVANSSIDMIALRLAANQSRNLQLTQAQLEPIHNLCFFLYYLLVPTSLALALTLTVGVSLFTLMRGLISAILAAVTSCVIIHLAFEVIAPFMIMAVLDSKDPRNIDLSSVLKPLLIAHLFGMGLGAAIAFAVAQTLFKPAWLKGLNGFIEGRSMLIPAPVAVIGGQEGINMRIPADGQIAPAHAQVDTAKNRHVIRPLQGDVFVNGKAVTEHWLVDNDLLQIGTYKFRYRTRLAPAGPLPPVMKLETASPASVTPASSPLGYSLVDPMGTVYSLQPGKTIIGRDPEVGISLSWEQTVSRRHAEVVLGPTSCLLQDLGSSNGTFVNEVAATAAVELRPGDRVRLGKCVLQVRGLTN